MDARDRDRLVLVIQAHWPHPPIDDVDAELMADALSHVSPAEVELAVERLVTTGERYQPRAPRILGMIDQQRREAARMRRELESVERADQRRLEAENYAEPRAEVLRLGRKLLDELRLRP